jgi:mycothiol S-conjugate amidase
MLAVHAHPDDESSKGAGTYAYYRSIGVEAAIVSCTGGERGDVLNAGLEALAHAERDIAGLRRIELARAQAIVGFDHFWLGYADSGLPDVDEPLPPNCFALIPLEISAAPLVAIIRRLRPQVLVTYDENGGYPHPDHIRAHEVAMFALEAAADPTRYPDAGEPWQISKTYYERIFNYSRVAALHEELLETDPDSPLLDDLAWFRERLRDTNDTSTTHVDVADFLEVRDAALRAHASQVAPDSPFFFWPNDLQRIAWPYEDFQLVRSLVDSPLPENDLFAGIITNQKVSA